MRLSSIIRLSTLAVLLTTLFSCNEKEEFTTEALEDYMPLAAGKYITYRVDSMVFTSFGRAVEIHKYQVKHIVDSKITDNEGRPSYRVYTFIRDSVNASSWTPAQPWINSNTYFITPLSNQVEVIEDNLRFIKLHLPIREGYNWNGNRLLPTNPYTAAGYSFSFDNFMADWNYKYDKFSPLFSYRGINYSDVYTVAQNDYKDLVDTFYVTASNQIQIPANTKGAWVKGNSTATITVSADAPTSSGSGLMRVYNYSNNPLKLNNITTPPGYSRNYQYANGQWGFGNNGKDTLYTDTPPGSKYYSTEKYAKKIGLVYKDYELWEYQPNTGNPGGPFKIGFGIKMWMIDHN